MRGGQGSVTVDKVAARSTGWVIRQSCRTRTASAPCPGSRPGQRDTASRPIADGPTPPFSACEAERVTRGSSAAQECRMLSRTTRKRPLRRPCRCVGPRAAVRPAAPRRDARDLRRRRSTGSPTARPPVVSSPARASRERDRVRPLVASLPGASRSTQVTTPGAPGRHNREPDRGASTGAHDPAASSGSSGCTRRPIAAA